MTSPEGKNVDWRGMVLRLALLVVGIAGLFFLLFFRPLDQGLLWLRIVAFLVITAAGASLLSVLISTNNRLQAELQRRTQELAALDQVRSRATQLETLNRFSTMIAGSLNPDEVFALACLSVMQMTGARHSAFYLLNLEQGRVWLTYSRELTADFINNNRFFLLTHNGRAHCLNTGLPDLVPDVSRAELDSGYLSSLANEGIQAFADFPLTSPDGQLGYLAVYFDACHEFAVEEVELLRTLAAQAAMALSNARLHERTDMALSRRMHQLTILETIGRELSSAFQSERLFEMILDYALEFTNSSWGSISLYDAQTREAFTKAWRGYPVPLERFSDNQGLAGRAIRSRQVVNIADTSLDEEYQDHSQGGARSHLSVPLIHEARVLGVLSLESAQPAAYSVNDESFVNQLASQASVALINAELYQESQRRLRELSTLYLVSTKLVGNLELEQVLDTVAGAMLQVVDSQSAGIYLWDSNQSSYQLHLVRIPPDLAGHCLPQIIPDLQLQEFRLSLSDTAPLIFFVNDGRLKFIFNGCKQGQILIFPIAVSKQRLGMAVLNTQSQAEVRADGLQLLRAIAAQGAIAIQNAGLFADVTRVRDRLAAILNSVTEGILLVEAGGQVILANEALQEISGISMSEFLSKSIAGLSAPALSALGCSQAEAEELVAALNQRELPAHQKLKIIVSNKGVEKALERSILPVWEQSGSVIGWMIVLRDITEEHQLAQERELITETLVHDLRSPISAVLGALEVLEESLPSRTGDETAVANQALQVARRGAERVLNLVETLMDIARLKAGKIDIHRVSIDMHHLVGNVVTEFLPQSNEYGILLQNDIPAELTRVCADKGKITRVLANLIDNALKFSPAGSRVVVSAIEYDQDQVLLQVRDNGPGIPEDYRERIFDRFSQVPGLIGRRRGTGLGLTFCRLAVEAHGGRIWIETNPGGGSIFNLTLPREIPVA